MTQITANMTIDEILSSFPQKAHKLALELTNAGLNCVGCQAASYETLEVGMRGHGMDMKDVEKLLEKLNAVLDEKSDHTTITLTPKAAKMFLEFLKEEGKQGWGMRFSEERAGCSGFQYVLDYSEKAEADDTTFTSHGIEIHVKTDQVAKLIGSEIDYLEGVEQAGFKVSNPNVKSSCGCGSSHGY